MERRKKGGARSDARRGDGPGASRRARGLSRQVESALDRAYYREDATPLVGCLVGTSSKAHCQAASHLLPLAPPETRSGALPAVRRPVRPTPAHHLPPLFVRSARTDERRINAHGEACCTPRATPSSSWLCTERRTLPRIPQPVPLAAALLTPASSPTASFNPQADADSASALELVSGPPLPFDVAAPVASSALCPPATPHAQPRSNGPTSLGAVQPSRPEADDRDAGVRSPDTPRSRVWPATSRQTLQCHGRRPGQHGRAVGHAAVCDSEQRAPATRARSACCGRAASRPEPAPPCRLDGIRRDLRIRGRRAPGCARGGLPATALPKRLDSRHLLADPRTTKEGLAAAESPSSGSPADCAAPAASDADDFGRAFSRRGSRCDKSQRPARATAPGAFFAAVRAPCGPD